MLKKTFILICLMVAGNACRAQFSGESDFLSEYSHNYYSEELGFEVPSTFNLTLYDTIVSWIGTPYQYAGNCKKGIDCSGFVTVLYDRALGLKLGARNSAEIYNRMEKVDPDDMKEGDLVFFTLIKSRISHIGVYLGNNRFVHSSTSRGVIISTLDEPYYKHHFAGAARQKTNDFGAVTTVKQE